jgi:hypothetical protein
MGEDIPVSVSVSVSVPVSVAITTRSSGSKIPEVTWVEGFDGIGREGMDEEHTVSTLEDALPF